MIKEIEAIYEVGIIRPVEPLESPEGTRLDVVVITHKKPCSEGVAGRNAFLLDRKFLAEP